MLFCGPRGINRWVPLCNKRTSCKSAQTLDGGVATKPRPDARKPGAGERELPMTDSIDAVVASILSAIPLRASRQMTATEYQVRVAEVLNLFDVEAVGDETGIRYGGERR